MGESNNQVWSGQIKKVKSFSDDSIFPEDRTFFDSLLSLDENVVFDYKSSFGMFIYEGMLVSFIRGADWTYFDFHESKIKQSECLEFLNTLKN